MRTEIAVILDKSGSMGGVADDTIGGFNAFLEEQKSIEGTARLTLVQFSSGYETTIDQVDISRVMPLTHDTYRPSGLTALYDAVGSTVDSLGVLLENQEDKPDKVIFVILTDGHENNSREYSLEMVKKKIEHQQEKYSWEFVFLGANQDAVLSADTIGIRASHAMSYCGDGTGTRGAHMMYSTRIARVRSGLKKNMSFEDE